MLQDSLPLDEPVSTSANLGLVKWMSEATESEANRPEPQESTDPHEPLSHASSDTVVEVVSKKTESESEASDSVDSVYEPMDWTYGLTGLHCEPTSFSPTPTDSEHDWKDIDSYAPTEEPFEQTEGKAWRLLAARIPQELFDDILFYVNVNRASQRKYESGKYLERNRGEPNPRDILTDLKQCSLVCLFWANRCRSHMFSERGLRIQSYEDAEIFRRYIVGGCPRLTPVHKLVRNIQVSQSYPGTQADRHYKRQCSFLHLLYLPAIQGKFAKLFIDGPVPAGFNPAKLDTPHWGISPSVVVPSSFLRNNIEIRNVHFPSFSHVIKYIRHFLCAAYIVFDTITWDAHRVPLILPHASSTIVCQRRPRSLEIMCTRGCTNSVHLALTAVMLNPNCPLHRLSDEEHVCMIKFMTLLWVDKKDPYVEIGFDVSEQATTMYLYPFHFVFEEASASTDRSASALSVVGMHAYIHDWRELRANFDALVHHARTHPTIRALVLLFDSLDDLQVSVKPFVGVLTPVTETIEILLAYEMEEERKAVGVDLVTLEPNGRIWTDLPVLTFDRYNNPEYHLKSLYILQRQLEKKPRGRFH